MLRTLFLVLLSISFTLSFSQKRSPHKKLSPHLTRFVTTNHNQDSITVTISSTAKLELQGSYSLHYVDPLFIYVGKVHTNDLLSLTARKEVIFINTLHLPKEEINTGASDPTLNLVSYAQHRFPQVRGDGITAAIKERRFDTTDLDLRGRIISTGIENTSVTTHASLMATIVAGAGNSSPFARGAAPGAALGSTSFSNLFPDPDSVLQNRRISIQNHSYGTIVENFYGNEAVAYDAQAYTHPTLLHLFSAGNSGAITDSLGPYANVQNMANLSGNFKQTKNSIAVSAQDSFGRLLQASSKGPAYDGRVKPDLVAYGEDGSSGAAALVSGSAILVQDYYSKLHSGSLPSSALTKAVLLNSANDVGEANVDYSSGYGSLNTYKALTTINDNRYVEDILTPSETKNYFISLPPNVQNLKLTLTWTDPAAQPNAAKALVNDLDIVVHSPTGDVYLPWVLNASPNQNSLLQAAQRKKDTLNNVEQVTIKNPVAGLYRLEVTGSKVTTPEQSFAIAHEADTATTFYWTYPTASDPLVAGRRHILRWHTNKPGTGKIEYATSDTNWRQIGAVQSLTDNQFAWTLPDTVTTARLRLVIGTESFLSDSFTISPQLRLETGFNCADSFLLFWKKLPVNSYRIYQLNEKYLFPTATLTDTAALFYKDRQPSLFFSVAPLIQGKEGIRSNTINYTVQGAGCYLRSFYLQTQSGNSASFRAELGTTYQVAGLRLEKMAGTTFVAVQEIGVPQTSSFLFNGVLLQGGENHFRVAVLLTNGVTLYSGIEIVYATDNSSPVFLYPNPVTKGSALKVLINEVGRYTLHVYNSTGNLVLQQESNSTLSVFSTARFSPGLYLVSVSDKKKAAFTYKLIIQ